MTEPTNLTTELLQSLDSQFIHPWEDMQEIGVQKRTMLSHSDGIYVYDSDGNKLMDAPAGMWCLNIGHQVREMADAIHAQVMQLPYNSPWNLASQPAALLASKLAELSPGDLNHVFFTTGGSTAVDSALRFVGFYNNLRGKPNKRHILSHENGYHGSTFLASSASGKAGDKKHLNLDTTHFHQLRNPNYHANHRDLPQHKAGQPEHSIDEAAFCDVLIEELHQRINSLGAENIAAFIAEPVLASGGVVVTPEGYLKRCAQVCRANDILVIADEVVTAFGRLGHFFASEDVFGITPDLITTAKGITSGYIPLGALLISDRLLDELASIDTEHSVFANGFTYSGHPVACAAALKNIDIIERQGLLDNVQNLAPYFQQQLRTLNDIPIVNNVRGMGLMACVECVEIEVPGDTRTIGERIDQYCQAAGLIVRPIYNMCVMSPPLTINKTQIDDLVRMLRAGIEQACRDVMPK